MFMVASDEQSDGPPRTPASVAHAFRDGDSVTLCGVALHECFIFPDVDFGNVFLQRCKDCARKAAVDGA